MCCKLLLNRLSLFENVEKRNEAVNASVSGDGCVTFSSCTAVNCKLDPRQNVT